VFNFSYGNPARPKFAVSPIKAQIQDVDLRVYI